MEIEKLLSKAISDTWEFDIKEDYDNNFLLYEDSLKSAFYYNLRNRLGKEILNQYNLRLYTEFRIPELKKKVDLAVVRINTKKAENQHLKECIESVEALIEFKYIYKKDATNSTVKHFMNDLVKLASYKKHYSKGKEDPLLYAVFIHEYEYNYPNNGWIEWFLNMEEEVIEKITELIGYRSAETGELVMKCI